MDRHNELLLSCLGLSIPDSSLSTLNDFGKDEWDSLVGLAIKYGVASVLYSSLCQLPRPICIPSEVRTTLRNSYQRMAARNMRVYQQLLKLLVEFRTEQIPVILLKGAHLAELVYGNIALRPMADIDILVRNKDLSKSGAILEKQGYQMSIEDVARSFEHLPPFRKKGFLDVEIHFNIAAPPISHNLEVAELWERSREKEIQGVPVLTLSPEDLLLHLCIHTTIHHAFDNGIRPFLDIDRTLDYYGDELDRNEVINRSMRWGVFNSVFVMLNLTHKFLGTPLQPWTLETVAHLNPDFDVVATAERLVFDKEPDVSFHVARLFAPGSWRDKFRVMMSRAFPPSEAMNLPNSVNINRLSVIKLYYFRLKGVISRHWKSVWAAMLSRKETSEKLEAEIHRGRLKDWFENG